MKPYCRLHLQKISSFIAPHCRCISQTKMRWEMILASPNLMSLYLLGLRMSDSKVQHATHLPSCIILSWLAPRFLVLSGSLFQVSLTLHRFFSSVSHKCLQEFLSSHSKAMLLNGSHWASLLKKFPDLNQVYGQVCVCSHVPVAFLLHYEDINQWVSATAVAGGSLFVRHLGGNPLHIHLGVHHPDLVQLDPLPRKKCKQIILPQNFEPVWMILNPWNSWRHVRHVVYLTISKWKTLGPIDSLELAVFSRASLPSQVLSLQTSLLAKLPGRSIQVFSASRSWAY